MGSPAFRERKRNSRATKPEAFLPPGLALTLVEAPILAWLPKAVGGLLPKAKSRLRLNSPLLPEGRDTTSASSKGSLRGASNTTD
jgi:hypothetical protein